ncbi:DUF6776 family protein [Oleiagrimonas soli]|uniref:Uncharacterized protein n=1 Tax=Oleiagrimonas soli TaxID=1543381 RepID=A0A099CT00_9GAMM|nr:DUF6776 family protein [Oleiagrimonas soli]KGI76762.1 hypothetical protein LF63_0114525 [Oleiagrimonas soli]MBB6185000.1 hypothetical protein [Oleiagrimonas soli]
MSIRPPPRYAVHPVHAPPARPRSKWWWALGWAVSLLIAIAIGYVLGNRGPAVVPGSGHNARQLAAENADLKQQLAIAQRSQQVASVATKKLTDNLAERDEQINGLRADLAFYSRLVGGGAQHQGLQLQMVHVAPVPNSRAWNIELTLTRNAKRGDDISGHAEIDIDGVRSGTLARMHWKDISAPDQKDGMAFKFKYFQQLHGTVMLPKDFTPNRLRISISPDGAKTTTQSMSWTDALKNPENTDHVE